MEVNSYLWLFTLHLLLVFTILLTKSLVLYFKANIMESTFPTGGSRSKHSCSATLRFWREHYGGKLEGLSAFWKGVWESHNGILMAIHRLFISLGTEGGWKTLSERLGEVEPFALKWRDLWKSDNKSGLCFKQNVSYIKSKQPDVSLSCLLILGARMKHLYRLVRYDALNSDPLQGRGFTVCFHIQMLM